MKNTYKTLIISLLTTFSLISCSGLKDKIDDVNPLSNGTMSAKIDGKDWKAETVQVISKTTAGVMFSIGGTTFISSGQSLGINFDLKKGKMEAGKTYTCGYQQMAEITRDGAGNTEYYTTDTPQAVNAGTIKIDKWDGTTISGTFSGTVYKNDLKTKIVITEGKFEGKVGPL